MHVVRVVGPLEPLQGRIVLTQPDVHQRRGVRWNVSFARHRFQCALHLVGFFRFSQLRAYVAPKSYRLAVPAAEATCIV